MDSTLDSGDNSSREYLSLPPDKDKTREYIVTMGPLHPSSFGESMSDGAASKMDTCNEFWKLCWMSGCRIVVMLCDISPGFQVSILNIANILCQFIIIAILKVYIRYKFLFRDALNIFQ